MARDTLVVLQPGYLPWLGFFDQMRRSSVFVYYDDVQFDKHGWRNRNRVKCAHGRPVADRAGAASGGLARNRLDVEIDNRIRGRASTSARSSSSTRRRRIRLLPARAARCSSSRWRRLVDLDLAVAELHLRLARARANACSGRRRSASAGKQSERLLALCQHIGSHALSLRRFGQGVPRHRALRAARRRGRMAGLRPPVYPQQHGDFVPYLSIVDLVFNCGEESAAILGRAGGGERL